MTASRILACVLLANLCSLVVLNGLSLRTGNLVFVYPAALASFALLLARARVRQVLIPHPNATIAWATVFLICLTVPRLPYLLEWIPGNVVLAQADDYGRLAELVSMTMTERYPLPHFANQDYLLSHYYTALYPMAFLKLAFPAMTLKDAIVAGNLLYHALLVFSLAEVAARWFTEPRSYASFLFLCSFFGGLDWLIFPTVLFEHAEHWPRLLFNQIREISSFYTGFYWVIHHVMAFYSVILLLVFSTTLRWRSRQGKITVLGMLLIGAFYSSLFASFTAFLVAPLEIIRLAKRAWTSRVAFWLMPMFLAPLFLYTHRVQRASIGWAPLQLDGLPSAIASLLYLLLAILIDFAGIPIVLFFARRRFTSRERALFWTSAGFLLSTGFVESIGYNNYSMRGMFLPTTVFFYLFARYCTAVLQRPFAGILILLSVVGTVREVAYLTYQPLMFSKWYWTVRGSQMPEATRDQLREKYATLARDRSVRYYVPDARDVQSMHKYNAEKLIQLPMESMASAEYELLRYPRRTWFW